jgi:hypothetical protein
MVLLTMSAPVRATQIAAPDPRLSCTVLCSRRNGPPL